MYINCDRNCKSNPSMKPINIMVLLHFDFLYSQTNGKF